MGHPAFSLANPNRVRSLVGSFALGNPTQFHRADGAGYDFLADLALELDARQPAARGPARDGVRHRGRSLEAGRRGEGRDGAAGASPTRRACRPTSATSCSARSPEAADSRSAHGHSPTGGLGPASQRQQVATKLARTLSTGWTNRPATISSAWDSERCGTSLRSGRSLDFGGASRMAGADTACVSARAGTILGITRSLAHPAFRRLEWAEPWLRLAVPALLVVFLLTLAASAYTQVRDSRESALLDAIDDVDVLATLAAVQLARDGQPDRRRGLGAPGRPGEISAAVRARPRAHARPRRRRRADSSPPIPRSAGCRRRLGDLLGEAQPLTVFADRAGVMTVRLADGTEAIATVRARRTAARSPWSRRRSACSAPGGAAPSGRPPCSSPPPSSSSASAAPTSSRRAAPARPTRSARRSGGASIRR